MATKIRLQRGGRKGYAFYRIVIADVRAPRDGRFTEKIGTYNPNTNPATVDLNFDRALYWVEVGAQPTDTVRNILKREGVYLMKHLRGGVKKGAFDEAAAQSKFDAWKANKEKVSSSYVKTTQRARKRLMQRTLKLKRSQMKQKLNRSLKRRLPSRPLKLRQQLPRLLLKQPTRKLLLKHNNDILYFNDKKMVGKLLSTIFLCTISQ